MSQGSQNRVNSVVDRLRARKAQAALATTKRRPESFETEDTKKKKRRDTPDGGELRVIRNVKNL